MMFTQIEDEEVLRMAIIYGKPSMTDLPPELGRRIFEQIRNSKPISDEERAARSKAANERLRKAEERGILEKQKSNQ